MAISVKIVTERDPRKTVALQLRRLWRWLVEPSALIREPDDRRQARLLSSLMAAILLIFVGVEIVLFLTRPNFILEASVAAAMALIGAAYGLSRTRYYRLAAVFGVGIINLLVFGLTLRNPNSINIPLLYYLILTVLLTAMLFSARVTAAIMVINMAALVLLPSVIPTVTATQLTGVLIFVGILSATIMVYINHRDLLEKDRQTELLAALQKAEASNTAITQANQELARAKAIAEESVRLKSEFISTMSHELRTPLNAVMGYCGVMLEGVGGSLDDEARQMVSRINVNSERLLNLINEVLDLARIEAGRIELVETPVSPYDLVEQWRTQMTVLANQQGLFFDVNVDPSLPDTLYTDPERLTQIATNLLGNAFKFTEQGSVTLNLKRQGSDQWVIQVTDTGIGIPPHALNYIFDEFRQVDGSSRRQYGGSGLGLAIVRNLCLMMRGTVKVSSKLGEGSTFTVTLPLVTETEAVNGALALQTA